LENGDKIGLIWKQLDDKKYEILFGLKFHIFTEEDAPIISTKIIQNCLEQLNTGDYLSEEKSFTPDVTTSTESFPKKRKQFNNCEITDNIIPIPKKYQKAERVNIFINNLV
jgi:hypothetical protein